MMGRYMPLPFIIKRSPRFRASQWEVRFFMWEAEKKQQFSSFDLGRGEGI